LLVGLRENMSFWWAFISGVPWLFVVSIVAIVPSRGAKAESSFFGGA